MLDSSRREVLTNVLLSRPRDVVVGAVTSVVVRLTGIESLEDDDVDDADGASVDADGASVDADGASVDADGANVDADE